MKTFIVVSNANYGLYVHVINAETKAEALVIAIDNGAWGTGMSEVTEIDTKQPGVVFEE